MNTISRDKSIDWLKGLAIFLVVMGHELQWCTFHLEPSQLLANGNTGLVQQWISSFHMPLLFFLSGFLIGWKKQTEEPTWSALGRNILRKMQTILLPGVTWMLVKHFIMGGWYIEWFLKVLFVIFVLFSCVRFISQRLHWHFCVEVVVHFVLFCTLMVFAHTMKGTPLYEHLCLRSIGGYYPYLVLGCFFAARGWNKLWLEKDWLYAISLMVFVVSYGLYYWKWFDASWAVYIMPYIIAFSIILTLYVLGVRIVKMTPSSGMFSIINNSLCYMGKHSLAIYVIHFYFLLGIPQVADFWVYLTEHAVTSIPAIGVQLVYGILAAIIVCGICLGLEFILSQSKILNLLCFGKNMKNEYCLKQ